MEELPTVAALRKLSVFDADQEAAYREHFGDVALVLGDDVRTRLGTQTAQWAFTGDAGLRVLTGNAGTGKTAVAEAFCKACRGALPASDRLAEVAPGRWVIKDLSGLPDVAARAGELAQAIELASTAQILICANEGVLRDAANQLGESATEFSPLLETALRDGAAVDSSGLVTIINANRQRPTSPDLWDGLLDYLTQPRLWEQGCDGCPMSEAPNIGCPMRANAAALRLPQVREGLRSLVRLGSGEAVPTLREVLAILAWAIVGDATCVGVKERARHQARSAFTAEDAYFARALGHGLALETIERSPLLSAMRGGGLGAVADLQVDEWLRDTTNAPPEIRELAGDPGGDPEGTADPLAGTNGPHDRVWTEVGTMTFHALGETVATGEDPARVDAGLDALVAGDMPRQALWRRRVFFERPEPLGGHAVACARLLETRSLQDLADITAAAADGRDTALALAEIVRGLNFLTCGFSSPNEGLIIPDQSCLFARDPGSFRLARPSLVQAQIPLERLTLRAPDAGIVREFVDVDFIDVDLVVQGDPERLLRLRPRLYEAIRQAAEYQGPVGQGIAEMADIRGFYGELSSERSGSGLRIADPSASPPSVITVRLPHFEGDV
jgi:hypothetical protein